MIIPQRWTEGLHQLQANGFPDAIIAGGALRDLDNGKPVKDVDVFVRVRDEDRGALSIKEMIHAAIGYPPDKCVVDFTINRYLEDDAETYGLMEMSILAIYEYRQPDRMAAESSDWGDEYIMETFPPIQIIMIRTDAVDFAKFVVDDFDIGLCQIWYTGHPIPGTIRDFDYGITNHYGIDKACKRLTVVKCPNENELERTKKRIARLLKKYPDFEPYDVAVKEEIVF